MVCDGNYLNFLNKGLPQSVVKLSNMILKATLGFTEGEKDMRRVSKMTSQADDKEHKLAIYSR